jgi:hypothetical protein
LWKKLGLRFLTIGGDPKLQSIFFVVGHRLPGRFGRQIQFAASEAILVIGPDPIMVHEQTDKESQSPHRLYLHQSIPVI